MQRQALPCRGSVEAGAKGEGKVEQSCSERRKTIGTHAQCEADGSVSGRTALGEVPEPKQHEEHKTVGTHIWCEADGKGDSSETEVERRTIGPQFWSETDSKVNELPSAEDKPRPALALQHAVQHEHELGSKGKPRLALAIQAVVKPMPMAKARPRQPGKPSVCTGSLIGKPEQASQVELRCRQAKLEQTAKTCPSTNAIKFGGA